MDNLVNAVQTDVHEVTPLLTTSNATTKNSADVPFQPRSRCTWHWTHVVAICAAICLTANMADNLSKAPRIRLYESVLCSEYWLRIDPSVILGDGSVPEALCKVDMVQDKLAKILGWQLFFDSIPAILLPIPYGYLADRYGRKWFLVISIASIVGYFATVLFVVGLFNLPLQYVWLSSLFSLFGGGSTVATVLLLTMIADVTPPEKRSITFFYLLTCSLIDECLIPPLTAILMARSVWIPLTAAVALLILSTIITMALPETLPVHVPSSKCFESEEDISFGTSTKRSTWTAGFVKFVNSFAFATRNATVVALIVGLLVSEIGTQSFDLLLQYVSKRYGWSLSKAGLLLSLRAAVNIVLFTIVIPLITTVVFSTKSATSKDLWIARSSIVLLMIGTCILFFSATPIVMMIGTIIYTFGTGLPVVLRSLVTTVVEAQTESNTSDVGRLYALISLALGVGNLIAGPGMAWAFRVGIRLGQTWLGLPFGIATVLFFLCTPVVFLTRVQKV